MYDDINKYWIRKGKVVGVTCNMVIHGKEHLKASMISTEGTSKIYKTYPLSRCST